jgi:hypothetical protein
MACQEFIFLVKEGGREEWREGKEYSLYRILIRMKLITINVSKFSQNLSTRRKPTAGKGKSILV